MKYQLVIQFPEKLKDGFDQLIEIEAKLEEKLIAADIDGHDFGSGQMNIFILTNDPVGTFKKVKNLLMEEVDIFSDVKAAYRDIAHDEFTCLWPQGLTKFQVV